MMISYNGNNARLPVYLVCLPFKTDILFFLVPPLAVSPGFPGRSTGTWLPSSRAVQSNPSTRNSHDSTLVPNLYQVSMLSVSQNFLYLSSISKRNNQRLHSLKPTLPSWNKQLPQPSPAPTFPSQTSSQLPWAWGTSGCTWPPKGSNGCPRGTATSTGPWRTREFSLVISVLDTYPGISQTAMPDL